MIYPGCNALFLTRHERRAASTRYRSLQFFPILERAGVRCSYSPLFTEAYLEARYLGGARWRHALNALLRRLDALRSVRLHDVVVIEKELLPFIPAVFERILAGAGVRYVVDFDDALFHQYDCHPRPMVRRVLGAKIASVMRNAAAVIGGNDYLAEYARSAGARRIEVLPTVLDLDRYTGPEQRGVAGRFTVGWIGSPTSTPYLEDIAPALNSVCAREATDLVLIGADASIRDAVPATLLEWSEETEIRDLWSLDVGIMPLPDEPWARGKCGFKLIQYMAAGLPVVASPVGMNREIVEHGVNGFLAEDEGAWVRAIDRLRADPELRRRMGRAGRAKVERLYTTDIVGPRLARLLKSVASGLRPHEEAHGR